MDLPTFIRKLGVEKSAILFDEDPRTIKSWLHGERLPRPATGWKIDERTKGHPLGRVRFPDIYASERAQ